MPDSHQSVSYTLGNYLSITYKGLGTFVEIKNLHNGEYLWLDPWITGAYPVAKDSLQNNTIRNYLVRNNAAEKLKGILVSHAHGDHFADVPEILAQLGSASRPADVYGDANVQSLICQYFSADPRYRDNYRFYADFTNADFTRRELTLWGNVQNRTDRMNYGLVHDLEKADKSFNAPVFADPSHPMYFFLKVTPIRWRHSQVPEVILGADRDLSREPGLRTQYVTDVQNTTCPKLHLYGFVFDLYRINNGKPQRRACFAMIPGPRPERTQDWKLFYQKAGKRKVPFHYFLYVPSSVDFIHGNLHLDGVTSRSLTVDGSVSKIFHTADGTQ
ncbi:MAG: hypothetical protein JXX29_14425 [Deltaproteobacteria bacterium]|nr:hypothetical protein [Deltaproteobacteria bacterium]MBN2672875.1 hypothetical protein [Deltaproteobacteria bacterium]